MGLTDTLAAGRSGRMGAVNQFTAQAEDIGWPDHAAESAAAEGAGQLGELDDLFRWICGRQGAHPPKPLQRPRLVVFAADHGVASAGVSRHEPGWAGQAAAQIRSGSAGVSALAERSGVGVRVVELAASARIDVEDALSEVALASALADGRQWADDEIDAGADLLIVAAVGAGTTTAASAVISLLSSIEPTRCVGRGSGIDDAAWMRKASAVRDARLRARPHRSEPVELLRVAGGADLAAMAAFVLQAALRRTPVLLDGLAAAAAAMAVGSAVPRAASWWRVAQLTPEPAHEVAVAQLISPSPLTLSITTGDGTGGLLAFDLIQAALQLRSAPG